MFEQINNLLNSSIYYAIPIKSFVLVLMGIVLRSVLIGTGQIWASSYSQTATYLLLPVITFVITSVISGNIALSLGMVGALSIVRFRNPVRSSLELVIFFLLITLGIAAAPKFHWSIFLFFISIFIFILIYLINIFSIKYFNKKFYQFSFTEGNNLTILEVESKNKNLFLNNDEELISFNFDGEIANYRIASNDINRLKKLSEDLTNNSEISKIDLNIQR